MQPESLRPLDLALLALSLLPGQPKPGLRDMAELRSLTDALAAATGQDELTLVQLAVRNRHLRGLVAVRLATQAFGLDPSGAFASLTTFVPRLAS